MNLQLDKTEMALREGIAYLGTSELKESIESFSRITEKQPDSGIAWLYLGDALLLLGDITKSKAAHMRARKLDKSLAFPMLMTTHTPTRIEYSIILGDHKWTTAQPLGSPSALNRPITLQRTLSLLALGSGLQVQAGVMVATYVEMFRQQLENESAKMTKDLENSHTRFGLWRENAVTLELLDRQKESIQAYSEALKLDPRDRLSQRGLVRTMMFNKNGSKYARFAKHKVVSENIQQMQNLPQGSPAPQKRDASEIIINVEMVQLAGNSTYVYNEYGKRSTSGD